MGRQKVRSVEGKVFTPRRLVDHMVSKLFAWRLPRPDDRVLDPGCGKGAFIDGIIRWCKKNDIEIPWIVGVELDSRLANFCRLKYREHDKVLIIEGDFLLMDSLGKFDFIIGNPPYVSLEQLSVDQRTRYKKQFRTATGRFDIYMLFFEKAISLLKPNGRLVFVTPEKYLYVLSAKTLRKMLAKYHIAEIELLDEDVFSGVLAYPAITVINNAPPRQTRIIFRDGASTQITLPIDGSPWLPIALRVRFSPRISAYKHTLGKISLRLSAGVATGRDKVFVIKATELPRSLEQFAWPTISGWELSRFDPSKPIDYNKLQYVILVPYDRHGRLLTEEEAKPLIEYLEKHRKELESRRVVRLGKRRWYAYHENPPMRELLRPKILWKDIARNPMFWADMKGEIIPRHNVYYLTPRSPEVIPDLLKYLNSGDVKEWLRANCQRAANGYLRLQATVLKNLPIPDDLYLKGLGLRNLEVI